MNKKAFASATAIAVVAGAVAGAVYYRHQVVKALDELLHTRVQGPPKDEYGPWSEFRNLTEEEAEAFQEALKQQSQSGWTAHE